MFVNSTFNELGISTRVANCSRTWDPKWTSFDTSKDVTTKPRDCKMCLTLIQQVKPYKELLYPYEWSKSSRNSGKRPRVEAAVK
jgi:hypothetical protein